MRSLWKMPYLHPVSFQKFFLKKKFLEWNHKNSTINQTFVDKKIKIYNGHFFKTINIVNEMIGFKFGEFIFSKIFDKYKHLKKKKKDKKKKNK
jgi:ribosomal protein S19